MIDREFEEWLIAMDDKLVELMNEVPVELSEKLDYSPESLAALEKWLITAYPSTESIMESDKYFLDRLACYVGETFRKNTGSLWSIDFSDDQNAFYGIPVVKREGDAPRCPLTMVTACLDRRRVNYLAGILNHAMEDQLRK